MALRKHKHEEHENHERWLVSYADFITLLFAFFAVLYATSQRDVKKSEEFEESVRQQFAGSIGFGTPEGSFNTDSSSTSPIAPPIAMFPPPSAGSEEVEEHVQERLKKDLKESDYKDVVESIRHDAYGVRIQLAANAIFPSASADLKEESIQALEKIGEMLKDSKRKVIVEGHTDDEPIRTSRYPSNWELAAARATKITRFLIQRLKIDPSRVVPVIYGSNRPIVPNTTPENRARNRRIEILIVNGEETAL